MVGSKEKRWALPRLAVKIRGGQECTLLHLVNLLQCTFFPLIIPWSCTSPTAAWSVLNSEKESRGPLYAEYITFLMGDNDHDHDQERFKVRPLQAPINLRMQWQSPRKKSIFGSPDSYCKLVFIILKYRILNRWGHVLKHRKKIFHHSVKWTRPNLRLSP